LRHSVVVCVPFTGCNYLMASPVTRRYTISVMNPAVVMA
jgi:hypothetical protein